ncbi:MAG TPA: hypothetical protein DIC52_13705 [Candidatus Latescibacteria bacterium]|nr:hypothetical protein [Candidatus Latescibacterota bacterium]
MTVFVSCAFDGRTVQGDAAHEDGIDAQFVQAQAFVPDRPRVGVDAANHCGYVLLCSKGADNGAHEK